MAKSSGLAAKSCCRRVLWLVFIAASLSVFGFHFGTLVRRFLSEPVIVQRNSSASSFVFPDLHFCPLKPFSIEKWFSLAKTKGELWEKMKRFHGMMDPFGTRWWKSLNATGIDAFRQDKWAKNRAVWETLGSSFLQARFSQSIEERFFEFFVDEKSEWEYLLSAYCRF